MQLVSKSHSVRLVTSSEAILVGFWSPPSEQKMEKREPNILLVVYWLLNWMDGIIETFSSAADNSNDDNNGNTVGACMQGVKR